ncbi:MAG TPA: phosphotransferase [Dermatophilaceae bacterium]|nr:phosphotransferase [Dermatophilaceae bacterium]
MSDVDPAAVLRDVNRDHGTNFELDGTFETGRQGGAHRVSSHVGEVAVFKCTRNPGVIRRLPQAKSDVARLRRRGYPTPAWLISGVTNGGVGFVVQELATGVPGTWATVGLAALCETIEQQAGLGHPSNESWSSYVEWAARDPAGPRRQLASTPSGRRLVAHFDAVLRGHPPSVPTTEDLVHGDMNTSNVLVAAGRISAVIDIEAIGPGTRAVDYAWLLREGFTVGAPAADLEMIRRGGVGAAGPAVFATCCAATAFDITLFEGNQGSPTSASALADAMHALADFIRA